MDDTELHYLTYDPQEIWDTMILNYVEAGGDILYPGDEKEMLLRSMQANIVQIFAGVDNALRMQTLRYAVGDYLDVLGELRGCERINASAARATVTIVTNTTGKSTVLEKGTAMSCDGELFYLLTEDVPLTGYEQTVTAEVIADREGNIGNGLLAGVEMGLAVSNPCVNKIVVKENAKGGNDKEGDEEYRERIRRFGLASITTGPEQQYESVAAGVSSDIIDVKAINLGAGEVGIYLILSSEEGGEAILQSVTEALSAKNVRPLTDHVSVHQATDVPYVLNVHYEAERSGFASTTIDQAVKDYQAWQDSTIGLAFNPDRLMVAIYQAGATRVSWDEGSSFNGSGEVKYTQIGSHERCKGLITLTAMLI